MRSRHLSILALTGFALILTLSPGTARAADPDPACKTAAVGQPHLASRKLASGLFEYYGRFELWTPDGNRSACDQRQILFDVGRLVDDDKPGTATAPVVTIIIQHGLFHRRAKDMTIYSIGTQSNGSALILYTVDAEAATPRKGAYFAQISVVGQQRN